MKKQIELTVEQARSLLGKDEAMDILIKSNFSEEELNPKPKLPKNFLELRGIAGFFISSDGDTKYTETRIGNMSAPTVFIDNKHAKSALAMAQLSQLMKVYNDGWEADWNDGTDKACVIRKSNNITVCYYTSVYQFLTFKTQLIRDEFLKNFEPLIRQYFMLD